MSDNRIASFYNFCIISSLIESSYVYSGHVSEIDCSAHGTFVRADDHHIFRLHMNVRYILQKGLDKLIRRLNSFKAFQRDCILYPWIVCVESDNIFYAHIGQLLKCQCTIQRFPGTAFVLSAFIKEWHNDCNTSCLATDGSDDSLQILKVIIRWHVVDLPTYFVRQTVVTDIHQKIDIFAANRFIQNTFGLAGSETRTYRINNIRILFIICKMNRGIYTHSVSPSHDVIVNFFSDCFTAFQWDNPQISVGDSFWQIFLTHDKIPPCEKMCIVYFATTPDKKYLVLHNCFFQANVISGNFEKCVITCNTGEDTLAVSLS